MSIDDMNEICKMLELLDNRIKIINQMLGYTKVGKKGNPLELVTSGGMYSIIFCGCELLTFARYDIDEMRAVFDRLECLNDGLWLALRGGVLRAA